MGTGARRGGHVVQGGVSMPLSGEAVEALRGFKGEEVGLVQLVSFSSIGCNCGGEGRCLKVAASSEEDMSRVEITRLTQGENRQSTPPQKQSP